MLSYQWYVPMAWNEYLIRLCGYHSILFACWEAAYWLPANERYVLSYHADYVNEKYLYNEDINFIEVLDSEA